MCQTSKTETDGMCFDCAYGKETAAGKNWFDLMNFIIDHRPIIVHQLWIDTGPDGDVCKMSYSKIRPRAQNELELAESS
jgi:hypothetical protein